MDSSPQDAHCIVCRRNYIPRTRSNTITGSICNDCKSLVADDNEPTPPIRNFHGRDPRRILSIRYSSSESIEDLFSQQFSQLINLARQNQESVQVEDIDRDSWFGESDSNFSFYGGESDIETSEMYTHQDRESHFSFDTDVDPMHAGLNQLNSDDESQFYVDIDIEESSSVRLTHQYSPENSALFQWQVVHQPDLFSESEDREFEELLEQFTEINDSRRGAPPASASAVQKLPSVIISKKNHDKADNLVCAVCKELLHIDSEAKQLPCMHLYHPMCILPWLNARNTCPVCRFELPTDDLVYEGRNRMRSQVENSSMQVITHVLNSSIRIVTRYMTAAAPIVSIVGIALALWFRSRSTGGSSQYRVRDRSQGASGRR